MGACGIGVFDLSMDGLAQYFSRLDLPVYHKPVFDSILYFRMARKLDIILFPEWDVSVRPLFPTALSTSDFTHALSLQ